MERVATLRGVIVRSLALVRSSLGLFPPIVPTFLNFVFLTILQLFLRVILPFISPCVCAWDSRSL